MNLAPWRLAVNPHWYTSSEWWLVIIAAITAAFICWQARETAKATRAMESNTTVFIESQKPVIAAEPVGVPLQDILGDVPRMRLRLCNKGQMPALGCMYESWIEVVADPETAFTDAADHFSSEKPFGLYPNHQGMTINIPIRSGLSDEQRQAIGHAQMFVAVRIKVTFRDAFTPTRFADFGYWVMLEGMGTLSKYQDSN